MDRWLFAFRNMGDMEIHCAISFKSKIDAERMSRAVRLLVDAEPILGSKFVRRWWRPFWERCNDLNKAGLCELVMTRDVEQEVVRFISTPDDPREGPQIRVRIFRAEQDTVCIKVCHLVADATGVKEIAYVLASIYRKLAEDPDLRVQPKISGSRSSRQLSRRFGLLDKLRMIRLGFRDSVRTRVPPVNWSFPVSYVEYSHRAFVTHRIGPEKFRSIKAYGARHRATLNDVLVAAVYRAMFDLVRPASDVPLRLTTTADLRRYLPSGRGEAICNLSGYVHLNLDFDLGATQDETVRLVRDQMNEKKENYIGLGGHPLSMLFSTVLPFAWHERLFDRMIQYGMKHGDFPPGLTNMGKIDPGSLAFGEREVEEAFLAVPPVCPPFFVIGASGFRESIILSVGFREPAVQRSMVERFFELLEMNLPGEIVT